MVQCIMEILHFSFYLEQYLIVQVYGPVPQYLAGIAVGNRVGCQ